MKRLFFFAVFLPLQLIAQPVKYVVLVSIDGFRPDFYKEQTWPTPNLQYLKNNGIYADGARSVFPSITYPSHTTIMTGALPATHGIHYNERYIPGDETGKWYWEYGLIKTPTLWDAVKKAGLICSHLLACNSRCPY